MNKLFFCFLVVFFISCSVDKKEPVLEQRIISLAPSITEIVYALGLQDRLLAVTDYCNYPPAVQNKEKVGGLLNPDMEKITSLRPTIILATQSNQQLIQKTSGRNIKVVLLPEKTVADLYLSIDSIAVLNGVQNRATALITSIRDSLEKYRYKVTRNRPRAILVLGRDPGTTHNIGLSGPGAFLNELWELCGGTNAFPDMPGSFTQVNREDLLYRNPNIIIEFKTFSGWEKSMLESTRSEWHDLQIDAVETGNIYVINGVSYLVPGPRIYLLARKYFKILQEYHSLKKLG